MRGDVKSTFAAWIAATNDFAVGSRPGSTRGRVLHFVQFIFLFFFGLPASRVCVCVKNIIEKINTFFV